MIRFTMPETQLPEEKLIPFLQKQFDEFLESEALGRILTLLGTDIDGLSRKHDVRRRADGSIREMQTLEESREFDRLRPELYLLLDDLGFFRINRTVRDEYSHLAVLGGSLNISFERTEAAKRCISSSTEHVDGLSCFRPIHPAERQKTRHSSYADTEFGVMSDAFEQTFHLNRAEHKEDFYSDRNINSISCIRSYGGEGGKRSFRVFAAPSGEPHERRADTADSVSFYLEHNTFSESDHILFLSSNIYCNRQFIQILDSMLEAGRVIPFEIVGCKTGDKIDTEADFGPQKTIQELISLIDWIKRMKRRG